MRPARLLLIMAAFLVMVLFAGCERQADTGSPEDMQRTVEDAQQVDVELGEWYITQTPSTVEPGPVQFNIRNAGNVTHAYELENGDFEERSPNLDPGETATMTISDIPAGEYTAYCPIANHADRGMRTTFTVAD